MSNFDNIWQPGDAFMQSGDACSAHESYRNAWEKHAADRKNAAQNGTLAQYDQQYPSKGAFWLLMRSANAQFCLEDFEGMLDTGATIFNIFKDVGHVVGNPFFHLRMGQASFELEDPATRDTASMSIDNLARALICGGIEIFSNEDPKYLAPVLQVLRPPAGFDSWHSAQGQGCALDQLNGASGFLATLFESKYGAPPPYPVSQ